MAMKELLDATTLQDLADEAQQLHALSPPERGSVVAGHDSGGI
jgi:hypothetical protein